MIILKNIKILTLFSMLCLMCGEVCAEDQKNRNKLYIFTAQWDLSYSILNKYLMDDSIKQIFKHSELKLILIDTTKQNSSGSKFANKYGELASPFTAMLETPKGIKSFKKLNLTSVTTFQKDLKDLLEHGIIAR